MKNSNAKRVQARIQRDKERKAARIVAKAEIYGKLDNVYTNQHMFHSLQRRVKDTKWKESVKKYLHHWFVRNKRAVDNIREGKMPDASSSTKRITLWERGKKRDICAVGVDLRTVQGVGCDYCITPLSQPTLIYDNPASTKGKGINHTRLRVKRMLVRIFKKHGMNAYIGQFDFSGFFDSIRHSLCREKLRRLGVDDALEQLIMYCIKLYQADDIKRISDMVEREKRTLALENDECCGNSLGSQISQNMALVTPNDIDHAMKDMMRVKAFIRYMDDGWLGGAKEQLEAAFELLKEICQRIGFKLNSKKTHITKISRSFMFLKIKYTILNTGKIIERLAHSTVARTRQRMKKYRGLVNLGEMRLDDAYSSLRSFLGNARKYAHSLTTRKAVLELYYRLFKGYRLEGKTHDVLHGRKKRSSNVRRLHVPALAVQKPNHDWMRAGRSAVCPW